MHLFFPEAARSTVSKVKLDISLYILIYHAYPTNLVAVPVTSNGLVSEQKGNRRRGNQPVYSSANRVWLSQNDYGLLLCI